MADLTFATSAISIAFNPGHAQLVRPQRFAIQRRHLAESGRGYVFERSSNEELVLPVDFLDLPEADFTTPFSTAGYSSLRSFLQSAVNWSENQFTLTDPDGDVFTVRYWGGFESLEEASGRTGRERFWTGTLTLREVI